MTFAGAIDAHVHLWDMAREDDILILESEPELAPMGNAQALAKHMEQSGVAGAIAVQSAPDKPHSDWLRHKARNVAGTIGVVGWIDPQGPDFQSDLTELKEDPLVCGVRIMLNRMQRPNDILEERAIANLATLADAGLTIECLAPPHVLACVARLAAKLPDARIVLDHCGLPPADDSSLVIWEDRLVEIAAQVNVSTKLSGLIEPFGEKVDHKPIQERALKTIGLFGPTRVMAASNHPVVTLGGGTEIWTEMLGAILDRAGLTSEEHWMVMRETALCAFSRTGFEHRTEVNHE